jgi:hypothetical protein
MKISPYLLLLLMAGCTVRGGWPRFLRPGETPGWHTPSPQAPAAGPAAATKPDQLVRSAAFSRLNVAQPSEGKAPFVLLECTAPTNGTATQAVWEVTQDFRTWKPFLTNQSAFYTGLPGACGFWRVRWQMK